MCLNVRQENGGVFRESVLFLDTGGDKKMDGVFTVEPEAKRLFGGSSTFKCVSCLFHTEYTVTINIAVGGNVLWCVP